MIAPPVDAAVARFARDVRLLVARAFAGGGFADDARLGLAVSGGPDSMAMLVLAAAAFPGRVTAATVDHRLRPDSAHDADLVADACRALGVPHATLAPDAPIAGSSLQRRAREARYAALQAWAAREQAACLLTAHHADDQAETLLMRLNRASGLAGLSAIRAWRFAGGIAILRPLLDWRRAELRDAIAATGLAWIDDPANDDPRHDRSRVRRLLAASPDLDAGGLARSAAYLAEAEEVIGRLTDLLWSEHWRGPDRPFAVAAEPRELRRRLIRRAIAEARAAWTIVLPSFAESSNVEPLLDALERGGSAVQGGVKVAAMAEGWRLRPAPPRRTG